jgi:hypothetical protein
MVCRAVRSQIHVNHGLTHDMYLRVLVAPKYVGSWLYATCRGVGCASARMISCQVSCCACLSTYTHRLSLKLFLHTSALLSKLLQPPLLVFYVFVILSLELSFSSRLNLLPSLRGPAVALLAKAAQQPTEQSSRPVLLVDRTAFPPRCSLLFFSRLVGRLAQSTLLARRIAVATSACACRLRIWRGLTGTCAQALILLLRDLELSSLQAIRGWRLLGVELGGHCVRCGGWRAVGVLLGAVRV